MEFDDEIDNSILFTDDPFHPSAKKKSSPPSTQKWHGKGSKAWFIIQMSGGNLRGEGIFVFFGWGSKPKHGVTKKSKGGRKELSF